MKQPPKPTAERPKALDVLVGVTELALTYRYPKGRRRCLIWRGQFRLHLVCFDFRTWTKKSKLKIWWCWRSPKSVS